MNVSGSDGALSRPEASETSTSVVCVLPAGRFLGVAEVPALSPTTHVCAPSRSWTR
ncbi:hypothetical protein ACIQVT_01885 [Streptomyces sp. NPDC100445]|uniref:hypothetical protein n=1 Tax=Streptomyces sp. NPDC100445 TaxID=3366102 RepID=UPI00381FA104